MKTSLPRFCFSHREYIGAQNFDVIKTAEKGFHKSKVCRICTIARNERLAKIRPARGAIRLRELKLIPDPFIKTSYAPTDNVSYMGLASV